MDFGSEKCHRFGFTFNMVTDLDSGLGSFSTTGWVGFWIREISWVWVRIRVHFLTQVGSVSESIIFDGFGFGFGLKLYYGLGQILDLRISWVWVWIQVQFVIQDQPVSESIMSDRLRFEF